MSDAIYRRVAEVLDTLPNGFPSTESGVEIELLKKVFEPDEAELFCHMRLTFETPEQVAERTGRDLAELKDKLETMGQKGQLFVVDFGTTKVYKMMPWIFGIYEFQLSRLDREFAELHDQYMPAYAKQFFAHKPQLMQVVPVEEELLSEHQALPYEKASTLIETSKSFAVRDCICKKEKGLMDKPCDRTMQVCMTFAPIEGVFKDEPCVRVLTKEQALALLKKTEDEALVHLTWNEQAGHYFVCNCCGCCCGVLKSINELGVPAQLAVNSSFVARIDSDECICCGICKDDRCQVNAVEEGDEAYEIVAEKCIGCGLCVSTCSNEAIRLFRKDERECETPPQDERDWFEQRGRNRGVDFGKYK